MDMSPHAHLLVLYEGYSVHPDPERRKVQYTFYLNQGSVKYFSIRKRLESLKL